MLKRKVNENAYRELIERAYSEKLSSQQQLQSLKNEISSKYRVSSVTNVELIRIYREMVKEGSLAENPDFLKFLRRRSVRTKSGIANITVLTKSFPCPGKCLFCPTEPGMPKSYLSNEPAMMRAILNKFSSYRQVKNRLFSLKTTGHKTDKIDLVVAGGTFSFYPKRYQNDFTKSIFNALNYPLPPATTLLEAQKRNEKADNRCIGLSFETRPDHVNEKEILHLRRLGCTKVEIGVQSLNDRVLEMNRRGHGIAETKLAMQLLRDAAFKINVHMMPNLYGSTPEIDLADMKELFANPAYRPDWMKVYPCIVVPWSQLEQVYRNGKYKSYSDTELIELMIKMTQLWPEYVRVTRIYRDIPSDTVIAGSKLSNLRQFVETEMALRGITSRDIRSREIKEQKVNLSDLSMNIRQFEASGGQEFFISYDQPDSDKLCSLLRLRFSSYSLQGKKHFITELEGAALIREVHAYGELVSIDSKERDVSQHIGLGRRMMKTAEDIALKNGFHKLAVISGIGVREYYRKLGYHQEGTYMVKRLEK